MRIALALMVLLASWSVGALAQRDRPTPYWASISSGQAMMRTGPGRNYPATWLYVRRNLPVRVVEVHKSWRKVEDPGGTTGWMLVNLLSDARTAIVRAGDPRPMHEGPSEATPLRYRAEAGVVGLISDCENGWCRFEVGDRAGFIRSDHLWGVSRDERLD